MADGSAFTATQARAYISDMVEELAQMARRVGDDALAERLISAVMPEAIADIEALKARLTGLG